MAAEPPVDLAEINHQLQNASPQDVIRWAVERFHPRLTMATAFGAEGCAIIHMLSEIEPGVRVFNLDTGYQFKETLELRDRIAEKYGIEVEMVRPDTTVEQYEAIHSGPLYETHPDRCCHDRKILQLRRAIVGYDAWLSAIRGDQTKDRANTPKVGWDKKFNLVKINPLLDWTKKEVWTYIVQNNVPYNPLHDAGYPSIGCWPCTRPVNDGEDDRAGRWAGKAKTECGLHSLDSSSL